jgi:hypothetical protein
VEGSGRGIISDTSPAFASKDLGKPRKTSVGIADLRAGILTRDFPNTKKY